MFIALESPNWNQFYFSLNVKWVNNFNNLQATLKKFLLTLILLVALESAEAKWVFISKDGQGNSYFYEDTKVVKDPASEEVSTWQMISYVERMIAPNGEPVYSVLQDISFFCRPGYESYKQFYIGYYSGIDGGGVAVENINTSNSNWERVIPDTMSELLFNFFCKKN